MDHSANKKTILFISNSQGTAAGLNWDTQMPNYPSLVQSALPQMDIRYWLMSDNSLELVDNLFSEMVTQNRPDLIILQPGIIEAALRILPKRMRNLLDSLPGGSLLTGWLHHRRPSWLKLLNQLGIRYLDLPPQEFREHLESIAQKCQDHNFQLVLVPLPPLSDQCNREMFTGNNKIIANYDRIFQDTAKQFNLTQIQPFQNNTDPTLNSLYLKDSVHFSELGHQLIAANILDYLTKIE